MVIGMKNSSDASFLINFRYSITVSSSTKTVAFDFTSKIIDYILTKTKTGDAESLIVLCEEELVAIDLISPSWPIFRSPYLASPHSSALTGCNMAQGKHNFSSN